MEGGRGRSEVTDLEDKQDESKKLALNEQAKREELSNKFEATILEIKSRMEEETDGHGSRKIHVEADELYPLFLSLSAKVAPG